MSDYEGEQIPDVACMYCGVGSDNSVCDSCNDFANEEEAAVRLDEEVNA